MPHPVLCTSFVFVLAAASGVQCCLLFISCDCTFQMKNLLPTSNHLEVLIAKTSDVKFCLLECYDLKVIFYNSSVNLFISLLCSAGTVTKAQTCQQLSWRLREIC